jgi:hypothetical protein
MHERTNIRLITLDRSALEAVVANRNSPQKHVWRAKIVLMTADGHGTAEIMRATGKAKTVIWRWQQRFGEDGATGLWQDKTPALTHSAAEPSGGRTRCGPDLGRAAVDRQPLDGRGDGEGRWDQRRQFVKRHGTRLQDPKSALLHLTHAGGCPRRSFARASMMTMIAPSWIDADRPASDDGIDG